MGNIYVQALFLSLFFINNTKQKIKLERNEKEKKPKNKYKDIYVDVISLDHTSCSHCEKDTIPI
jgi:hypothetical protein